MNGHSAIQFEITGIVNQLKVHYVHTFIESDTRYNQLMCWTTPSNVESARPEFEALLQSFTERPAVKGHGVPTQPESGANE